MIGHRFAERPIPSVDEALRRKEGYRARAIDRTATEHEAECVDLDAYGLVGCNHYGHSSNPPYFVAVPGAVTFLRLRRPVAERLAVVEAALNGDGLGLYVFDAWRPDAVQRYFHDSWFPAWLRRNRPGLNEAELSTEVERYWSAPTDSPDSPAPHLTGAAVDLTLRFLLTGQCVFMGSLFDELTGIARTDHFEHAACNSMSDATARAYRRILYWTLIEAGFVNNPTEWWHYSFGDQMWAALADRPAAVFGACDARKS